MSADKQATYSIAPWVYVDPLHVTGRSIRFWCGSSLADARDVVFNEPGCAGLNLLEKGATATSFASVTGLNQQDAEALLQHLRDEGIVCEALDVPASMERYSRHLVFFQMMGTDALAAQRKIRSSRVLLLGVGGIGTNIALALAGLGVGELTMVDNDFVEESNLTRQFLFAETDVGRPKVEAAAERVNERNSEIAIKTFHRAPRTAVDVVDLLSNCDFLFLSADQPPDIGYITDEACFRARVPYCRIGYRNALICVGPTRVPGRTGCGMCSEESMSLASNPNRFKHARVAPSFGPYNMLASAFAVSEFARLTAFGDCSTFDKQFRFDGTNGEQRFVRFPRNPRCTRCT